MTLIIYRDVEIEAIEPVPVIGGQNR